MLSRAWLLVSGIIFALLSALGFGLANGLSQKQVRSLGIAQAMLVRSAVSSIILLSLFALYPHEIELSGIAIAALVSGLGILAVFSYYRALSVGVSGIVTPVANSAVIVTLALGAALFSESLGAHRYALIGVVVVGIVLVSYERSQVRFAKGLFFALGAMVLWGASYAFLSIPVRLVGPIATPLVGELIALFVAGALVAAARARIVFDMRIGYLVLIGIFVVMGVVGFTFALRSGVPAGLVAAISAANPVVTALYMRIVHGERLSSLQRFGSVLVIVGVVVLSLLA